MRDQWAVDLLDKLMCLDPKMRIDADNALNHDFFWSEPMAVDLGKMLSQHSTSMFEFLAPPKRGRGAGGPMPPQAAGAPVQRVGASNADSSFERVF